MIQQIDIRNDAEICEQINAILNNKGIAEIKDEGKGDRPNLVVVEIKRTVKTKKKSDYKK
jgi:hypothetical protein